MIVTIKSDKKNQNGTFAYAATLHPANGRVDFVEGFIKIQLDLMKRWVEGLLVNRD